MKVKVYLNDWFYNAGVIGFINIFESNENNKLTIYNNYIEFESEDLKSFAEDYFNYFFEKYNIAEKTKERIDNNFKIIKENLEKRPEDNEEERKIREEIKRQKKYSKDTIKIQLDKIKKFDEGTYTQILNAMNKIDEITEKEQISQLDEIQKTIVENLEKENINQRLTMNSFKSMLSNDYYGQISFLNVVNNALTYSKQQKLMYRDYISNIVETGFLRDILENKYTLEEIKLKIEEKDQELLTKETIKIYNNIEKQIDKGNNLEQIKQYLSEKAITNCTMCENEAMLTNKYSEGNFMPLAVSSENMSNFFWNQNINMQICDVCKLILFCIPAGVTSIIKIMQENGKLIEKEIYSFVNYDTSIRKLRQTNENFKNKSKKEIKNYNPYPEIIADIVKQEENISNWQLQNIFVAEFEAKYLAYSRIEYFNISRNIATFFSQYADKNLNLIYDYKFRVQIVEYILKNKDIKNIITNRLRENFKNGLKNNFDSYLATKARMTLNLLKKGEKENMQDLIQKNNSELSVIYNIGMITREKFKNKHMENKLEGCIYRLLNCVKQGNKGDFMDMLIRIHIAINESISPIFIDTLKENQGLDFEDIGHAYLAGLASEKYEKDNKEENNNE